MRLAIGLLGLVYALVLVPAASLAAGSEQTFHAGDVIARTERNLRLYRQGQEIARFGQPGPICVDSARNVWVAKNSGGALTMCRYTSTLAHLDYQLTPSEKVGSVCKVLQVKASLFIAYTAVQAAPGQLAKMVQFSPASGVFGKPFPLRNSANDPEVVPDPAFMWDAAYLSCGQVWFSGYPVHHSGGIGGYVVDVLPPAMEKEFGSDTLGKNVRSFGVNPGLEDKSGNNRGFAAWSKDQLLVLDGTLGRLSVMDPMQPDNPQRSFVLLKRMDPSLPESWGGFAALSKSGDRILASSTIARKIYVVDLKAKPMVAPFATDVVALELTQVQ